MAKNFPQKGNDQDYSRLLTSLNQSKLQQNNPALYQTIALLIRNIPMGLDKLWEWIEELEELIEEDTGDDAADYVVLADGGVDAPTQPIGDGGGSFIYIEYN